jgi:SRSO17 transposase
VAYVEKLVKVIGHADRAGPLRDYCTGLVMPCERKSVEPMAAVTAPARVGAQHQSLLHFVGEAAWSDARVLAEVRTMVLPAIERHGPIEAWIIDDTGFPKQGRYSVGVARQYCGQLGKQDNCQVAVSLSIANHDASLPVAYQLYLPKDWAKDRARRRKAGVPKEIGFKTKPAIALEQLRWACEAGLPRGVVLMDAGYGADTDLRASITTLGLSYSAGIMPNTTVWAPGTGPLPSKNWSGHGRPPKLIRRDANHRPISVKALARGLPKRAWHTIEWREGTAERLSSRFARVRVRVAHRDYQLAACRPEEWLLIEWPEREKEPILALDPSRRHHLAASGRLYQAALAHRARLSGAQAGGRPRPLRGPRMARLPSPRHTVHRSLRIPHLRAGDDSPLRTSLRPAIPAICATRPLPTQRLHLCAPNGTFRT